MTSLPTNRLPLIIGVSGHRDLRDEDVTRLEQEVAKIIRALKDDYLGNDEQTPIIVLSALAEGADQLVARVALSEGAQLIAPLPMPLQEYRRDFSPGLRPSALREFDRLLAEAIAIPVMPFAAGSSSEFLRENPDKRDEQYRAVGLFIARHCHVLIALWDGVDTEIAVGGTAEVVAVKRRGISPRMGASARLSLDASEIGPVVEITVPRVRKPVPHAEISLRPWGRALMKNDIRADTDQRRLPWALPTAAQQGASAWASFAAVIKLTCRFNKEAARLDSSKSGASRKAANLKQLFAHHNPAESVDSEAAERFAVQAAGRWCAVFETADTLALERQRRFRDAWFLLFAFGLSALLVFDVATHLLPELFNTNWLLAAYCAILGLMFVFFIYARRREYQERFLDYRALAEALRVVIFWKLAGVAGPQNDTKNDSIADVYPIKQPSELAWIKMCLRTLELLDSPSPPEATLPLNDTNYFSVRELWVGGQLAFFTSKSRSHNETAEKRERISVSLVAFTLFLAMALFALSAQYHLQHDNGLYRAFIFTIGILPGIAAVLVGYTEQLALKAQARQYDRMRVLFERAYQLLPKKLSNTTPREVRAILAELGSEAMREHAEWFAIYRQRPIRLPQG